MSMTVRLFSLFNTLLFILFPSILNCSKAQLEIKSDSSDNFLTKQDLQTHSRWRQSLITFSEDPIKVTLSYENIFKDIYIKRNGINLGSKYPEVLSFQSKIQTTDSTLYFLCYKDASLFDFQGCCIVSLNIFKENQFYACSTENSSNKCLIKISYNTDQLIGIDFINVNYSTSLCKDQCDFDYLKRQTSNRLQLPPIFVKKRRNATFKQSLSDDILLEYTNNELTVDEDFTITIFILENSPRSEFFLKCEIPEQTFIEFQYITPIHCEKKKLFNSTSTLNCSPLQQWQVEVDKPNQQTLLVFKARRIQRKISEIPENKRYAILQIVFKILRVPELNPGFVDEGEKEKLRQRKMPRLLWNLHNMSGESSVPSVTRFVVKSTRVKNILIQFKEKVIVRFDQLLQTGNISRNLEELLPIKIFGLTHDNETSDVTNESTCYSSKDSVLKFKDQLCNKPFLIEDEAKMTRIEDVQIVAKLNYLSTSSLVTFILHHVDSVSLEVINNSGFYQSPNKYTVREFYQTPSRTFYSPVVLQAFVNFSLDRRMNREENHKISLDIQKFINENLIYQITSGTETSEWISVNEASNQNLQVRVIVQKHSKISIFCSANQARIIFKFVKFDKNLLEVNFQPVPNKVAYLRIDVNIINTLLVNWDIQEDHMNYEKVNFDQKPQIPFKDTMRFSYAVVNFEVCPTLKSSLLASVFSQTTKTNQVPSLNDSCMRKMGNASTQVDLDMTRGNKNFSLIQLTLQTEQNGNVSNVPLLDMFEIFKQEQIDSPFHVEIVNNLPDLVRIHLPSAYANWFSVKEFQSPIRTRRKRQKRSLRKVNSQELKRDISLPAFEIINTERAFSGKIFEISLEPNEVSQVSLPMTEQKLRTRVFGNIMGNGIATNMTVMKIATEPDGSMNEEANNVTQLVKLSPSIITPTKDSRVEINKDSSGDPPLPEELDDSKGKSKFPSEQELTPLRRIAPLELGMYVLLGFSILVALVFSVNCGAIVARYKWERRTNQARSAERNPSSSPNERTHPDLNKAQQNQKRNMSKGLKGFVSLKKMVNGANEEEDENTLQKDSDFIWLENQNYQKIRKGSNLNETDLANCQYEPSQDKFATNNSGSTSDDEINFVFKGTPRQGLFDYMERESILPPNQPPPPIPFQLACRKSSLIRDQSNFTDGGIAPCPQCQCPCQDSDYKLQPINGTGTMRTLSSVKGGGGHYQNPCNDIGTIANCCNTLGVKSRDNKSCYNQVSADSYTTQSHNNPAMNCYCKECCAYFYHNNTTNPCSNPSVDYSHSPPSNTRKIVHQSCGLGYDKMATTSSLSKSTKYRTRAILPSNYPETGGNGDESSSTMNLGDDPGVNNGDYYYWLNRQQIQHECQLLGNNDEKMRACQECQEESSQAKMLMTNLRPSSMLTVDSDLSAWGHELTRHYDPEEIRDYIKSLRESNA